jgi:NTE family protein
MKAFVLSGGANYGAIQVGALQVLLENEIFPDMVVGVSAGALNAAWFARQPTLESLRQLERVWCQNAPAFFKQPGGVHMLLRLVQGQEGVLTSGSLQRFITKIIPPRSIFAEIQEMRLYITAVRLRDGWLRAFGDCPNDRILDALMASTALPTLFPPWPVEGDVYVDGGVLSNLPLHVAVERGAKEIYALDISKPVTSIGSYLPHGIMTTAAQSILLMHQHQVQVEIAQVRENPKVHLHYLSLQPSHDPGFWEFSMAADMIADGRRITEAYLARQCEKRSVVLHWLRTLRQALSFR